jgi:hypothetical protein
MTSRRLLFGFCSAVPLAATNDPARTHTQKFRASVTSPIFFFFLNVEKLNGRIFSLNARWKRNAPSVAASVSAALFPPFDSCDADLLRRSIHL